MNTDDAAAGDRLTRFLLPQAGVRGVHVQLHRSWLDLLSHAAYPPAARRLLGEACAAAAMLTAHAKIDGRLSLQLRADAGLRLLFAECTAAGTLRGIAQLDEGADAPPDLRRLERPVLAITIENPGLDPREPLRYQSLVELSSPTLDEVLEDYFRQSEQLPSRLLLAAADGHACGLMLQKLPGDEGDDDGWARAGALFDTLAADELASTPGPVLLHRLFHEEAPQVLATRELAFGCSCSRERVAAMLQSLGEEEARAAAQDGQTEIQCGFCGRRYVFPLAEIGVLFEQPSANAPTPDRLQ
ncbi:Hsp33 family molecular chaperone HslO [Pseudoxanthomonas suwonensis]|uniref:Heat shock protein Hsp33 n=1 Tax=Pseudoxanthomonas suwonensis TaxID=314722 RepID=A0A0E3Z4F9_9GAMM|nr:Hsp33 family molecular chaperone HslO [Pseudoxanthomonas suwonensis]AKC87383.1 heat shock protein Hsp33 [Pseudoxanthomonas suwonensis]